MTTLSISDFPNFLEELRAFWAPNKEQLVVLGKNSWFKCKYMEVYLRIAFHHIEGKTIKTLDVGNVNVFPKYQKQGVYKSFLEFIERELPPVDALYVESVLLPDQYSIYTNRGYTPINNGNQSFYKLINTTS